VVYLVAVGLSNTTEHRSCQDLPSSYLRPSTCIGVARILFAGVHFFAKKVDDLILVVAFKDRLNIPPILSYQAKTVLKIDSCSGLGVHFVS